MKAAIVRQTSNYNPACDKRFCPSSRAYDGLFIPLFKEYESKIKCIQADIPYLACLKSAQVER